jgi:hypothetical protein
MYVLDCVETSAAKSPFLGNCNFPLFNVLCVHLYILVNAFVLAGQPIADRHIVNAMQGGVE